MDRMYALNAAGVTATAAARVRVQQGLGHGWQFVDSPCTNGATSMNFGAKRLPGRLGRST